MIETKLRHEKKVSERCKHVEWIRINGRLKGLLGSVSLCLFVSDNMLIVQNYINKITDNAGQSYNFTGLCNCACNTELTSLRNLLVFIPAGAFAQSISKIMILLSNSCVKRLRLINLKFE